ncbi:hypothetical protein PC116_g28881 [Phytophthora cactorum]|uniref:Uncharacterized protein n=1 Tax=Phytophthora cactorum TaxID=29920 RepID=A0A8T0XT45_9STRA|nr:hypothetical protein PC111_g23970 [Phytophthora cactorum]KAG2791740.1 hypothetical protein PC112_g24133 [Phytophthora cactorum]KAG2808304.1 hypothetical protein PC113_g23966 [Phytophthora cactorum]KAG2871406.1 hypothetical protein PC114_g26941 [Phytophthora cactorum]KAG2874824.1 hypothetical protein PC115_g24059 [Phytophthora cactorum]
MSLSCTRDVQWVEEDQPDPNEVHGYESPKFPVGSMTQPIVDWGNLLQAVTRTGTLLAR